MKNKSRSVLNIDISSLLSILPNSTVRLLLIIVITFGFGIGYGLSNGAFKDNLTHVEYERLKKDLSVLILIGLGVGFGYGLSNHISQNNFTRAEYERLTTGMPIMQVESILGAGIETEQSTISVTFIWKNPNGSTITVTFENDKLIKKQQRGLI